MLRRITICLWCIIDYVNKQSVLSEIFYDKYALKFIIGKLSRGELALLTNSRVGELAGWQVGVLKHRFEFILMVNALISVMHANQRVPLQNKTGRHAWCICKLLKFRILIILKWYVWRCRCKTGQDTTLLTLLLDLSCV